MTLSSITIPEQPTSCFCDCEKNRLWADVEKGQIKLQWGRTLPIRLGKTIERLKPLIQDLKIEGVPDGRERALLGILRAQVSLVEGHGELKRHLFKLSQEVDNRFIELMQNPPLTQDEKARLAPAEEKLRALKALKTVVEKVPLELREVDLTPLEGCEVSEESKERFIRHLKGEIQGVWLDFKQGLEWIALAEAVGDSKLANQVARVIQYETWQKEAALKLANEEGLRGLLRDNVVIALAMNIEKIDLSTLPKDLAIEVLQSRWIGVGEREVIALALACELPVDQVVDFDHVLIQDRLSLVSDRDFENALGSQKNQELARYWYDQGPRPEWMFRADRAGGCCRLVGCRWKLSPGASGRLPDGNVCRDDHTRQGYVTVSANELKTDIEAPKEEAPRYQRLTGRIHLAMQYLIQGGGHTELPTEELLSDPYQAWTGRPIAVEHSLFRKLEELRKEAERLVNLPYLSLSE